MKKIRINFEKFSYGILIPQFPWPKQTDDAFLKQTCVAICSNSL